MALPYSPPPYSTPVFPCPLATDWTAPLTVAPGEAIVNGDFLGVLGCGASSWALACGGVGGTSGGGAAWAGAGACWAAGGGSAVLGGPGLRAFSRSRRVCLSTDGAFVCASRSLSDMRLVLGGALTFCASSGSGTKIVS